MFDFFKKNKDSGNVDVKGLREQILQSIKEELQKLDGGEGKGIVGLHLFVSPDTEERFMYETALYRSNPEQLEEEIQRIADNFAIDLPAGWKLEVEFVEEIPVVAVKKSAVKLGIWIKTTAALPVNIPEVTTAKIKILKGTAEQEEYTFDAGTNRINIGRERSVESSDGSFRINTIAFPQNPAFEGNKYISRQHAHIEWDKGSACFMLYADEGGVPPGNKTKIRSAKDESVHKLNSAQVGYQLRNGDQVILADMAVLEFFSLF